MAENHGTGFFATLAMAEILLGQDLWAEAGGVLDRFEERHPGDPRLAQLRHRLAEKIAEGSVGEIALEPRGMDRISLGVSGKALRAEWEITEDGIGMARRAVGYSGTTVLRLFTASRGPRGVRCVTRDLPVAGAAARVDLRGLPRPAVHVASVGFLGNNGRFVPVARSATLGVEP
ncbi:MAG: hypothetical protein PHU25_13780 [Deltaproteobacteria bacterium]|nr:hypothetical protein [Deltaproteobacteria bacterium]